MKIRLSNSEKLLIISNLATLLSSGVPILEAVDSLEEGLKGNSKKVIEILEQDLKEGKKMSDSFARFPEAFDPVTINLIKAAEEAGTLETSLKDLTINIKKDMDFSDKVIAALAYPFLVIVVFSGVLLLILLFVIPRIADVFGRLKVTLPLPTRILIAVSTFILTYKFYVIAGFIALILIVVYFYKTQKRLLFYFVSSLPLLSDLVIKIDFTRFTRSLSLLLSSGIPITDALELSKAIVFKKQIYEIIVKAKEAVSSGKKLSEVFRNNNKLVPSIVVRITEAGEKSGTLDKSMQDLAEYFDTQVGNSLKMLTTLLEPILLVTVGVVVGGMMLAIVAPIYNLIGQITPK